MGRSVIVVHHSSQVLGPFSGLSTIWATSPAFSVLVSLGCPVRPARCLVPSQSWDREAWWGAALAGRMSGRAGIRAWVWPTVEPELLTARALTAVKVALVPKDAEQAWGAGVDSSWSVILRCERRPPGGAVEKEIKRVLASTLILSQKLGKSVVLTCDVFRKLDQFVCSAKTMMSRSWSVGL